MELDNFLESLGLQHLMDILKANGINSLESVGNLIKDCNFRDFEHIVPVVKNQMTLWKKYYDFDLLLNVSTNQPREKLKFEKENFILKDILLKTAFGNTLLQISQYRQNFTSRCQSLLCNIIVTYLLNLNIRYTKNILFFYIKCIF
ncbi:hypothetical protein PUN28_018446 [Cardiocondyla obscurior]|uniref:Uncharacterized protein n=1 Tax=Cardiocondyla obscurior TaxID=286306 RepID=A0AAW2EHT0_9HYME